MTKQRFTLNFPPESSEKPLTYHLIKDYNLKINILKAEITAGKEGHLLIEVEGDEADLENGLKFLMDENIEVIPLNQQITLKEDECVHCGACTAVCFPGALKLDRATWKLIFKPEECVVCGLCVNACPLGIINIGFGTGVRGE
jgi:ferredoxin